MTACDFKPKSQSTDYPRPCTEEDVSVSVRDKYFNQVENFLSNFYLLSIFLPAAGIKNVKTESYNYSGCYWGGDSNYVGIKDGYKAIQLNFTYAGHKSIDWCTRYFGRCIRAVAD